MKTTQALAPETSSNTGYPVCVYAVVYEQYQDGGYDTEDRGALWLLHGGNSSRGCVKIATVKGVKIAAVRGVNAFETGLGISSIVTDLPGNASGDVYMQAGSAVRTLYQPGNINPSNIIVSEEAKDVNDTEAEKTAEETITQD